MIALTLVANGSWAEETRDAAPEKKSEKKEPIGTVLGMPVFREQLKVGVSTDREMRRLFLAPLMEAYRKTHAKAVTPMEEEIAAVLSSARKTKKQQAPMLREELSEVTRLLEQDPIDEAEQRRLEIRKRGLEARLKPPGRFFALFVLNSWKLQKHLYDHHGGGRVLWQQGGVEAFDATRRWLEASERAGQFSIADPALRDAFYHYWTTHNHGAFLTADKDRIRESFIEPAWMAAGKTTKLSKPE